MGMQNAFSEMKMEGRICWPPLICFQKNLILLMKQCLCRDVNWSFISPPARLGADGGFSEDKTGKYRLGKDDLLMDGEIPAGISVADLAVAIADDAEHKAHLFERFTVAAA